MQALKRGRPAEVPAHRKDPWLNINDAAQYLGCSVRTVRRMVSNGWLGVRKDGVTSPLKFRYSELERFASARYVAGTGPR